MKVTKHIKTRKYGRWVGGLLATPILLFLLLALLVYMPPVQRWLVDMVSKNLSESTGVRVQIKEVRLAFPLDLAVKEVTALRERDTLLRARSLRLDVKLLPLFKGRADVEGLALYDVRVDTRDLVSDVHLRGKVGSLEAKAEGVDWKQQVVRLNEIKLLQSELYVALSDTGVVDTTSAPVDWQILTDQVELRHTALHLSMPGDSLRLSCRLGETSLQGGNFDLAKGRYQLAACQIRESGLTYALCASHQDGRRGNDAFAGALTPLWEGWQPPTHFSTQYIALDHLSLQLEDVDYKDIYRFGMKLSNLCFQEHSGLKVNQLAFGVQSNPQSFQLTGFRLTSSHSDLTAHINVPWQLLDQHSLEGVGVHLNGNVGAPDMQLLAFPFIDETMLKALPLQNLSVQTHITGKKNLLQVDSLFFNWENVCELKGHGQVEHPFQNHRKGTLQWTLRTGNMRFFQHLLGEGQQGGWTIPNGCVLQGKVGLDGHLYTAQVGGRVQKGNLHLEAATDTEKESYRMKMRVTDFPLSTFLPQLAAGPLTARLEAVGHGYNPLQSSARLRAKAEVNTFRWGDWPLDSIAFEAGLAQGKGEGRFSSNNDILQASGTLEMQTGKQLGLSIQAALPMVNLHRLAGMKDTLHWGTNFTLHAYTDRKMTNYGVQGALKYNRFLAPEKSFQAKDVIWDFASQPDTTHLQFDAGDLKIAMGVQGTLGTFGTQVGQLMETFQQQIDHRAFDQYALKDELPVVDLQVNAGTDNPVSNILRHMGYTYSTCKVGLRTDPLAGLSGHLVMSAFKGGNLLLDDVEVDLSQDTAGIVMDAHIKNHTRKNPNKFDVKGRAYLLNRGLGAEVNYKDSQGKTGVDIGLKALATPEGLDVHLYPAQPVIAYRRFTVNADNHVLLGKDKTIRADVDLLADDGTGIRLYGEPVDSMNDLTLSVHRLNLNELSEVLPYLPRLGGLLSGDVHLTDDGQHLSAMAMVNTQDLSYEEVPLGNVGVEAVYLPKEGGEHHANAYVSSEGTEVMALDGTYYSEDEGHYEGNVELLDFPMTLLNGFLVGTDMALRGKGGGNLTIQGSADDLSLNGALQFKEAHVYSDVYGFDFRLDETPVNIENGKMQFQNYGLHSKQSANPLLLNGVLDMTDLAAISMDLQMKATNFELINTKRKMQSLVYGKVYVDYNGTLKGTFDDISVRGKMTILGRTDMTYILKDSPLTIDNRLQDLVQFVSFTDSIEVEDKVTPIGNFDMVLGLSVSDAARFHCNLSEDGENYVDIEGGGDLTLRMTKQEDMRLTGRFVANRGEMKYSLPIIPLKTFQLKPGSYVDFTGDMMNPTLNITATERVKATVTENDVPRSVAFDVGVNITQPLEKMGLEFIINAPEDLSMQNQLASMTMAQRGKTAVAMLATGMYLNDESMSSGGSGFKASNALNAFLQSEIQNIAGSALKTIDVSIGMESGVSSMGTATTDYSFQFAKRFWGNRISVIIGGKVSTGADAQNSAESFIDNVSVEYRLDKGASRYVRVFYDRGTHDPFEGQLTTTGAGLVLRRKTNRLGELFIFKNKED